MSKFVEVACQFCGESGFDVSGVKAHLLAGDCDVFESITVRPGPFGLEVGSARTAAPAVAVAKTP
jgi:hypothetical protein